jgi:aminoglycoside N3'-acetyltransferase
MKIKNIFDELLETLNISRGDVLYIHSSYTRIKNFGFSAIEIIDSIMNRVGEKGTVVFPSFTWNIEPDERPWKGYELYFNSPIHFDVNQTPSNIGYLAELFRFCKGVKRSLHPFWSLCARGLLAETITQHPGSIPAGWIDEPYGSQSAFRLLKENNVKIIGLGVTLNTTSLCPLVDHDLGDAHPQIIFTNTPLKTTVINKQGQECVFYTHTLLPEVVKHIKPGKVFECSNNLNHKLRFLEKEGSFFFSYHFTDYYESAMALGREAIRSGQKVPWLEFLPLKTPQREE